MAFLRALLDTVNDVPNVAAVVVMIASEKDNMDLDAAGQQRRNELDAPADPQRRDGDDQRQHRLRRDPATPAVRENRTR